MCVFFFVMMCQNQGMIFLIYLGVEFFLCCSEIWFDIIISFDSLFHIPAPHIYRSVFLTAICVKKSNNIRQDHIWVSKNTDNLQVFFFVKTLKKRSGSQSCFIFTSETRWKAGFTFSSQPKTCNKF